MIACILSAPATCRTTVASQVDDCFREVACVIVPHGGAVGARVAPGLRQGWPVLVRRPRRAA